MDFIPGIIISTLVWIVSIGSLTFYFRERISQRLLKTRIPLFLLFLLTGTAYSLVEENINCPLPGCSIIPSTLPFFILIIAGYFLLLKAAKVKSFRIAVLIFGVIGWVIEFFFGSYAVTLWSNPVITIFFTVWTILTYSVIAILPASLFVQRQSKPALQKAYKSSLIHVL